MVLARAIELGQLSTRELVADTPLVAAAKRIEALGHTYQSEYFINRSHIAKLLDRAHEIVQHTSDTDTIDEEAFLQIEQRLSAALPAMRHINTQLRLFRARVGHREAMKKQDVAISLNNAVKQAETQRDALAELSLDADAYAEAAKQIIRELIQVEQAIPVEKKDIVNVSDEILRANLTSDSYDILVGSTIATLLNDALALKYINDESMTAEEKALVHTAQLEERVKQSAYQLEGLSETDLKTVYDRLQTWKQRLDVAIPIITRTRVMLSFQEMPDSVQEIVKEIATLPSLKEIKNLEKTLNDVLEGVAVVRPKVMPKGLTRVEFSDLAGRSAYEIAYEGDSLDAVEQGDDYTRTLFEEAIAAINKELAHVPKSLVEQVALYVKQQVEQYTALASTDVTLALRQAKGLCEYLESGAYEDAFEEQDEATSSLSTSFEPGTKGAPIRNRNAIDIRNTFDLERHATHFDPLNIPPVPGHVKAEMLLDLPPLADQIDLNRLEKSAKVGLDQPATIQKKVYGDSQLDAMDGTVPGKFQGNTDPFAETYPASLPGDGSVDKDVLDKAM